MKRALKQRSLCSAVALALGSAFSAASSSAEAEDISEPRGTIRIEVTGSHINRSDVETALPVQVISQEDIARSGSMTVAELMSKISANVGAFGDALSIGNQVGPFPRPGLASVNLRGIGDGSTLVLVNGRRMANYAFDGGTVDVNSIPVAAIDRVEILKDGASAIYGTDAIAGVVNFILRKDFQGLELTGYGDWTQQGGGNRYQAIVSAGHGDLARDRYNVFVSLNYQKDAVLHASERQFARTGYRPGDGLFTFNAQSFPANINARHGQLLSPNYASGCAPPVSFALTSSGSQYCAFDPVGLADLLPRNERASAFGRATFQVTPNLQLFVEAGYAHNQFALTISPTPFAQPITSQNQPVVYPAGGPFYPTAFAAANGISGDLNLRYRTVPWATGSMMSTPRRGAWSWVPTGSPADGTTARGLSTAKTGSGTLSGAATFPSEGCSTRSRQAS